MTIEQYNARLRELVDQMARRHKLKAVVSDLEEQRRKLADQVQALKEQTYQEQLDVDRLENMSAAKLFYQITGRLEGQLEKEQAELYAAALRYDGKRKELHALEADLEERRRELDALAGCEREYARLLEEKARAMKSANSYYENQLDALEERIAYLDAQERELREAISAGNMALGEIQSIQRSLSSAEGWGTWDVFGGGMISDMAKYSHMDEAQRRIQSLQRTLSRFRAELADVSIQADLQLQVDGFLRFADYFFDNIFTDWAVLDRIRRSQSQMEQAERSVQTILSRLDSAVAQCRRERDVKRRQWDELVLTACGGEPPAARRSRIQGNMPDDRGGFSCGIRGNYRHGICSLGVRYALAEFALLVYSYFLRCSIIELNRYGYRARCCIVRGSAYCSGGLIGHQVVCRRVQI